jgi:hypothetical protein
MHKKTSFLVAFAIGEILVLAPLSSGAQDDNQADWNHFGLNYRLGFNIGARFKSPGLSSPGTAPAAPAVGAAVNRAYSDGFVNVDSSGNAGKQTWDWGYQNASQISGGSVLMHAASVSPAYSENNADDFDHGFEASYMRDLGHESWGRWGLKFAFDYTKIDLRNDGPLHPGGQLVTDAYALNGVIPPNAPYSGSYSGPGPVLGSSPTRTTTPLDATVLGSRRVDASLCGFHAGPAVALDLTTNLSLELGGGLAWGAVTSTLDYDETITSSLGSVHRSGSASDTGGLVGAYAEAGLACHVARTASIFAGAQFQYLGEFDQNAAGHGVQLDFSRSVFLMLGFELRF